MLEREGYAVSAGFALGLVALGMNDLMVFLRPILADFALQL